MTTAPRARRPESTGPAGPAGRGEAPGPGPVESAGRENQARRGGPMRFGRRTTAGDQRRSGHRAPPATSRSRQAPRRTPPAPRARTPPPPRAAPTAPARPRGPRRPRPGRPRGVGAAAASRPACGRTRAARRRGGIASAASLRQAEQPLGDDVALDLVGAGVDRPGEGEDVSLAPTSPVRQFAVRAEQVEGRLVQRDVLAPTRRPCSGSTRRRCPRSRSVRPRIAAKRAWRR